MGLKKWKITKVLFSAVFLLTMILTPLTSAFAAGSTSTNLRIGWTSEPDSLSPFITYEAVTTELFLMIYDPLVGIGNDNQPVPKLAKSWDVSSDHLTWTFHLQQGVKWHDGQPFTSADVKFTYETLMKSKLGLYSDFENGITSITTPDDYTVVMKTKDPKANMLQITTPILPKHIWEKVKTADLSKWPNTKPIGTGAFKFVEWKKGQDIQLEANKDYFLGSPHVDKLIFKIYGNNDTLGQALTVGEIDAASGINEHQYKLLQAEKNISAVAAPDRGFTELAFNSWTDKKSKGNPLMLNKDIRHAIEYAINKKSIINVAYAGLGTPGSTLVPDSYPFWHYQPTKDELRSYNVDQANKILDKAGFTKKTKDGVRENAKGQKLEFRLLVRSKTSEEVKAGNMIKDMLDKVGIKLDVTAVDDGVLNDKIYSTVDFDMFIWGWGTDLDPTTILRVLSTDQIANLSDSYYSNKQYDALLAKQQTIIDTKERQKAVWDIQKIAYEDAPYDILLYGDTVQAVRTDKFTGWKPIEGAYFFGFNNWNYTHVEPVVKKAVADQSKSSTTASSTVTSKATASQASSAPAKTASSSSNTVLWIVIILLAAAVVTLFMRNRKKSDFDRD